MQHVRFPEKSHRLQQCSFSFKQILLSPLTSIFEPGNDDTALTQAIVVKAYPENELEER